MPSIKMGLSRIQASRSRIILIIACIWAFIMPGDIQAETTTRVSVDSSGSEGDSRSMYASISADGRYVAFASFADNLVPNDTNGHVDIFVHDRQTGVTSRVSVDSSGNQGNGDCSSLSISADGRFVIFSSLADNLVSGDTNNWPDVFVHDCQTGSTTRVSVDSSGTEGDRGGGDGGGLISISEHGRYAAFYSLSNNLVVDDTNNAYDVFVHDCQTGNTIRVSISSSGIEGNGASYHPSISADGRYVAFASRASNLVSNDTNGQCDIFVRDRQAGTTTLVSVDSSGNQGNGGSDYPSISADGRFIAFNSIADNLVTGDTNGQNDIFIRDCQAGTTTRVSVDSSGNQGNGNSTDPSISPDGRYAAFESEANNLISNDTNYRDIFVHDCQTGITTLASVDSLSNQGDGSSYEPSISTDGRYIAFESGSFNLVPNDTNNHSDIFVRENVEAAINDAHFVISYNENYYNGSVDNIYNFDLYIEASGNFSDVEPSDITLTVGVDVLNIDGVETEINGGDAGIHVWGSYTGNPNLGEYIVSIIDDDFETDSHSLGTLLGYPQTAPNLTYPTHCELIATQTPTFTWDAYGFSYDGNPLSVQNYSLDLGIYNGDGYNLWIPGGQTSEVYGDHEWWNHNTQQDEYLPPLPMGNHGLSLGAFMETGGAFSFWATRHIQFQSAETNPDIVDSNMIIDYHVHHYNGQIDTSYVFYAWVDAIGDFSGWISVI